MEGDVANKPKHAGWYPDPSGKRGKKYWDGSEWFDRVPSARKYGSPKVYKMIGIIAGVATIAGVGIAILLSLVSGNKNQPTDATSTATGPPAPSTPNYMSLKTLPNDGVYKVGGDQIDPGVWESLGPADALARPCEWIRLSEPRISPETTLEAGGVKSGTTRVTILPTDAAFSTEGCQAWHMVEGLPGAPPASPAPSTEAPPAPPAPSTEAPPAPPEGTP